MNNKKDINNISTITYLFGNKINSYITYLFVVADWDSMEDVASIAGYQKYEENWTSTDFENEYSNDYFEWYSNNNFNINEEIKRITKNLEYFNSHKSALIKQYNNALKEYNE